MSIESFYPNKSNKMALDISVHHGPCTCSMDHVLKSLRKDDASENMLFMSDTELTSQTDKSLSNALAS